MITESKNSPELLKESDRLKRLIEKYKDQLGNFRLVPIGDTGFILQSQQHQPAIENDWIFFDYDDTLVATTAIKEERLKRYCFALERQGVQLSTEQAKMIISLTDKFSRWEENEGEGRLYHANSHMLALDWATKVLKRNSDSDTAISIIQTKLDTIKQQLTQDIPLNEDDPFYFNRKSRKLIMSGINQIWSKEIEQIFISTMINPPQYEETIQGAIEAGKPALAEGKSNLGIFTYGDPYYQLLKTFELLTRQPDLKISQIWLTKQSKGNFIISAVKSNSTDKFDHECILSKENHVISMVDDDPKQLDSILACNEFLEKNTGAQFVVIRSIRPDTKEQHKEWEVNTEYGQLDFRSKKIQPNEIYALLLINRYINTRARLGIEHINSVRLSNELSQIGITEIL